MRVLSSLLLLMTVGCGDTELNPLGPTSTHPATQTVGSWKPVLGGSLGTENQVYASQHGEFVKTGMQVFVSATITLVKKGTIRGALEIQGLPFPSSATHDSACHFGDYDDAGAAQVWVSGIIGSGSTVVMMRHRDGPSMSMSSMSTSDVSDITALEMSCTYITGEM